MFMKVSVWERRALNNQIFTCDVTLPEKTVQLFQARTQAEQLRNVTILRLELLGCYNRACLVCSVRDGKNLNNIPVF